MKKKIVLWGTDEKDEKILVALELIIAENKVKVHTFKEAIATEAFYNDMMDKWRAEIDIDFPEGSVSIDRELSMTDDLLPETIKVQRTDLIARAKTEWHFAVLSSKLYELYKSELEDLKDKISKLSDYENSVWEEMKGFWSKVQSQAREKNLFREHTEKLKELTNQLFDQLKELKSKANKELSEKSKETFDAYVKKLDEINEKVKKGLGLNPIFEELKKIQAEFKNEVFTREDRSKIWNRIDEAFKAVKEKKYGKPQDSGSGSMSRLQRRFEGLLSAIGKMEQSIERDKKDINFQSKKVDQTYGQLEMQIRQAKIKMVEERINSKTEKLNEMLATKSDLEKRLEKEKVKEKKKDEQKEIAKVKEQIKDKIASEIKDKSSETNLKEEKLKDAAEAINEIPKTKKKKDNMMDAIAATMGEALEDVVDTVKAVSEVVGEKVEEKIDELKDQFEVDEKVGKMKETASEIADQFDIDKTIDKIKEVAEDVKDKIEDTIEKVVEEVEHIVEKPSKKKTKDEGTDEKETESTSEEKSTKKAASEEE